MPDVTIHLDPVTARFYQRIAEHTGLHTEQVLSDALFKLAGELALQSLAPRSTSESSNAET